MLSYRHLTFHAPLGDRAITIRVEKLEIGDLLILLESTFIDQNNPTRHTGPLSGLTGTGPNSAHLFRWFWNSVELGNIWFGHSAFKNRQGVPHRRPGGRATTSKMSSNLNVRWLKKGRGPSSCLSGHWGAPRAGVGRLAPVSFLRSRGAFYTVVQVARSSLASGSLGSGPTCRGWPRKQV